MWLVIIAVLNTVISAYYYLRVVRAMWQGEPEDKTPIAATLATKLVLIIATLLVLVLGLFPFWGLRLTEIARILLRQ